jgi:hypothetical protein
MCRVDDSSGWKLSEDTKPKAHREWVCEECQRTIRKGEVYHSFRGLSYDYNEWQAHRMCAHCGASVVWLNVACGGWIMTEVLDELEEHWREEEVLRSSVLESLIAGMKAKWSDGADPIPDKAAIHESVPADARTAA